MEVKTYRYNQIALSPVNSISSVGSVGSISSGEFVVSVVLTIVVAGILALLS